MFLAVYIAMVNWLLQEVFDFIGKRRSTKNITDNYFYRMLSIFVSQYINTAILYIFAYHSFAADPRVREQNLASHVFVGPFQDYNQRWYLVIGAPVVMVSVYLSVFPHVGVFIGSMKANLLRLYDRQWTTNKRKTRQIIQREYELLYTGPEFILQLRYSQILSQIFITLTFSPGLPILYLITFISFVISYWVDKFLILRYFKKENQFTSDLSRTVLQILKLAVPCHILMGFFMYQYPELLKSESSGFGNESLYFNKDRVG